MSIHSLLRHVGIDVPEVIHVGGKPVREQPKVNLTEDDVRRIVREELSARHNDAEKKMAEALSAFKIWADPDYM